MSEDEYESLPENSTMGQHMIAGACAGIMEHSVMYPVDSVKTRLQCLRPSAPKYSGLIDGLTQITRTEGLRGCVRGMAAVVGGAGPAHALYFACYEKSKTILVDPDGGYWANKLGVATSGALATLCHDAIMTPADAVKQRVQLYNSAYSNSCQCLSSVVRNQGVKTLYRAYSTQLVMNVPMQSCHFLVYESCQGYLNPEHVYQPMTHMLSGGIAGAVAAFVTTPLDVCKTVLNTQEDCAAAAVSKMVSGHSSAVSPLPPCSVMNSVATSAVSAATATKPVTSLYEAMNLVWTSFGVKGFFRGWQARVLFQMPGTAISWSVYEFFKSQLKGSHSFSDS